MGYTFGLFSPDKDRDIRLVASSVPLPNHKPHCSSHSYTLLGGSSSAREREREQAMSTEPASFGGGGDGGKYDLMQEEYGSASAPVPGTVVRDSVLSVSYSVQGKSTIPSDGLSHMVSVAQLEFDCQIRYVAVPRVEAVVYLQVSHVVSVSRSHVHVAHDRISAR